MADALDRVSASALRVQLARRFHNDAVRDVRRVRAKWSVQIFGLAGYAALPEPVVFDDGCRAHWLAEQGSAQASARARTAARAGPRRTYTLCHE